MSLKLIFNDVKLKSMNFNSIFESLLVNYIKYTYKERKFENRKFDFKISILKACYSIDTFHFVLEFYHARDD